MTLTKEE